MKTCRSALWFLMLALFLGANGLRAEDAAWSSTIKEDAARFMQTLGEGPFAFHKAQTGKVSHRAAAVRELMQTPITFYNDDKKDGRGYFWLEDFKLSKKRKKASFKITPISYQPGQGVVKGRSMTWDSPELKSNKIALNGRSILYAFNYSAKLSAKSEDLRGFAAFLYLNGFNNEANAVLTTLAARYPKDKPKAYALMRTKHEWPADETLSPSLIGPEWVLTLPIGDKSEEIKKTFSDEWEAWCKSELELFAGQHEATHKYCESVSWESLIGGRAPKGDVFSWAELLARGDRLTVLTKGSEVQRKMQLEAADITAKAKAEAEKASKKRSKRKKRRGKRKPLKNHFLILADATANKKKTFDTLAAAATFAEEAKSAKDRNLGQDKVRVALQKAAIKAREVFPWPDEKRRKAPAIGAVDPLMYSDLALIMRELSVPNQYNLAVDNAEMAKSAISLLTLYLNHFPMNSAARYHRGKVYMSLFKTTESRKDFQSIIDDKTSPQGNKDRAKSYLTKIDKAVINRNKKR